MLTRPGGAAAPVADFSFSPVDPSVLETVQFSDSSYDPAQAGIRAACWELGDGTTAIGSYPSHRYTADGEYRARLTITTADGRTASITRIVSVRTHDVSIAKLDVPRAARRGETRAISVDVASLRYPETVQVELFRNSEVEACATLIKTLRGREAASFEFSYTLTPEDAAAGFVTFRAVATVVGARDARPADNAAVAAPTEVWPAVA